MVHVSELDTVDAFINVNFDASPHVAYHIHVLLVQWHM